MFDPETFMSQTVDAANATTYRLCPEGTYQATIDEFDPSKVAREIEWDDKKTGEKRTSIMANIPFVIQDEQVKATLERDKVVADWSSFLDFDAMGQLDTGPDKNVKLGQLKEALGQNKPGWNFLMLRGAGPVMVQVKHEQDKKDKEKYYARISKVMPIR